MDSLSTYFNKNIKYEMKVIPVLSLMYLFRNPNLFMCVYLSIVPFLQHQTYFFTGFLPPSIQSHTSLQIIHMSHKVYPYA